MKFYNDLLNGSDLINNIDKHYAIEGRNIMKDMQIKINSKPELFFTNSPSESVIIFALTDSMEKSMKLFGDIRARRGVVISSRMRNFFSPKNVSLKLPGRNLMRVFSPASKMKEAAAFGIKTIVINQSVLTNHSVLYDFSSELGAIRDVTIGKAANSMNPKMRKAVMDFIRDKIVSFPTNDKIQYENKLVVMESPFLTGTNIKLLLLNKDLMNMFRPALLVYDWLANDMEGFKKFMVDNNVSFVFKGMNGKSLFLTPNKKILESKLFNPRFIMRILHMLDENLDPEVTTMTGEEEVMMQELLADQDDKHNVVVVDSRELDDEEDIEAVVMEDDIKSTTDSVINHQDDDIDESFDDVNHLTQKEIDEAVVVDDTDTSILDADLEEIESATADSISVDYIIKRNNEFLKTMDEVVADKSLSESEKVSEILEIHTFSDMKTSVETKEVKKLKERLSKQYGRKVEDVVRDIKDNKIKTTTFKNVYPGVFSKSSFVNMNKAYEDVAGKSDYEGVLTSPSNSSSSPLFLTNVKESPINDREFFGKTIDIEYEDTNGNVHPVSIDYPISRDGKLFIGGSYKQLNLQDAAKPVIKTDEDVIITTSYNKTFLSLKGSYGSKSDKQLMVILKEYVKLGGIGLITKSSPELGPFIQNNLVSYEMIHMNRLFSRFILPGVNVDFRGVKSENGVTLLGNIEKTILTHDPEKNIYWMTQGNDRDESKSLLEFMLKMLSRSILTMKNDEERQLCTKIVAKIFKNAYKLKVTSVGVNSVYAKVMARDIPIIFLMLVALPLKDILNRLRDENGLEYKIIKTDRAEKMDEIDGLSKHAKYSTLKFGDGTTLVVKFNNTLNEIILTPLMDLDMSSDNIFNISDVISKLIGSNTTIIYLENFVNYFLSDPSIQRVLKMYNIPEDFVGVLIYASSLFASHRTTVKSDSANFRVITTSEVVNRCLYDVLTKAVSDNTARVKMGSRSRVVIPRDALIRRLQDLPNLSENTNLSPFRYIMEARRKSLKGHMGTNQSRAFGVDTRMFAENNLGTETACTPYSGEAGVTKTLPMNPVVDSVTGEYKRLSVEEAKKDPSKAVSFIESYVPYLNYDHIIRVMMANNQFSHVVPAEHADPMLVSYGSDESALYMSGVFAHTAEEDGIIVSTNESFTKIKYNSGRVDIIPMDTDERNADKGYFVPNKMELSDGMKAGTKFKAGDSIARNKFFFKKKSNGRVGLSAGPIVMIGIFDSESTWEDSCVPFDDLSEKLSSTISHRVSRVLSLNTEIRDFNTDIKSNLDAADVLFKYRVLEEDEVVSNYFAIDDELSMSDVKSGKHGILKDIRVYWRKSRDTHMSESMKKFVNEVTKKQREVNYTDDLKDISDAFKKVEYQKEPTLLPRGSASKINGDRIENGEILIEYFIETKMRLGSGDKIVVDRALKGEPSDILPNELRPVGCETGRNVSLMFNTYSLLARITPGMILHGITILILYHIAIKNRMILNRRPDKDSILNYKSSRDMVSGKIGYKD